MTDICAFKMNDFVEFWNFMCFFSCTKRNERNTNLSLCSNHFIWIIKKKKMKQKQKHEKRENEDYFVTCSVSALTSTHFQLFISKKKKKKWLNNNNKNWSLHHLAKVFIFRFQLLLLKHWFRLFLFFFCVHFQSNIAEKDPGELCIK